MNIDLPHMIVSAMLIFAVVLMAHRTAFYKNASPGKRAAIVGVALFLVIFLFNLVWPYGESPVFLSG
jgi:hypothetical protein